MKRTILLTGVALSMFAASRANAQMYVEMTPYVGLDYTYADINHGRGLNTVVENDYNIFTLSGGAKFGKYFGAEAFIQRANREENRQPNTKYTANHWAYGADLLGYLPVYQDLDLLAGIGLAQYKFFIKEVGRKTHKDTAWGTRFTVGAQYNLDYNWGIRATYRYVNYTETKINRANEYSVGIRYSF